LSKLKLIVHAGNHNREYCPVSTILEGWSADDAPLCAKLLDATGKPRCCTPAQVSKKGEKTKVTFVVERLQAATSATYELGPCEHPEECTCQYGSVELKDQTGEKVEVFIRGSLFTSYNYNTEKWVRPFLYPVIGPFGRGVTRDLEGEGKDFDHPHHKSIYVAHGYVNGANCWDEMPGHGTVRHENFKRIAGGPVFGEISALNSWRTNAGVKVCEQTSYIRFYNLPANARLVDFVVKFHATEGDLTFGDTKEGGILSLRVYPTMNVNRFGRMENGYGAINEKEIWGKRAPWCDYSGPVCGEWVGITYMNHPTSFRYPTHWHARDYGLMTANPFGLQSFEGPGHDGTHTVPAGESLTFAYRIYIHPGDAQAGKVAERFHDYINPPEVEVV